MIVAANLLAMLIQMMSAKLGLATGRNLPELCREHFPRAVSRGMWVQAELVAIATNLAEVIGGAIALNLLFGVPLFTGGLITGLVAFGLLAMQGKGYRPFELAIAGLFAVILLGFVVTALRVDVAPAAFGAGLLPRFEGTDSLLLATGILGATVMSHVIYLHSALTQRRIPAVTVADRRFLLRHQRVDVLVGMGLAGLVNAAMLVIPRRSSTAPMSPTPTPCRVCTPVVPGCSTSPPHSRSRWPCWRRASRPPAWAPTRGRSSCRASSSGAFRCWLRRVCTLAPALVVLGVCTDPTRALVLSQVVLSFGIPFALVPLVMLTRRRDVMAELVNNRLTTVVGALAAAVIITLNALLLWNTFV